MLIYKLIDYLLLNACSVRSAGLYSGKAGFALTLEELSRYFESDYFADRASDLLEESLLIATEDVSLDHGLAGVGFVLLHFIARECVEVEFKDLFGIQHKSILRTLESGDISLSSLRAVYYLLSHYRLMRESASLELLQNLMESHAKALVWQLRQLKNHTNFLVKSQISAYLELYLSVLCHLDGLYSPSTELLQSYGEAYLSNKLQSSYFIGVSLTLLQKQFTLPPILSLIAQQNLLRGEQDIYLKSLDLRVVLHLLLCYESINEIEKRDKLLLDLGLYNPTEQSFIRLFSPRYFRPGYEGGIARYLLYLSQAYGHGVPSEQSTYILFI